MRSSLIKRGLGLALSCAMVFGLVACGQKAGEKPAKESDNGSKQTQTAAKDGGQTQGSSGSEAPAQEAQATKRVVAGTVAISQILDKLGYKQVVGVPDSQYDLGSYKEVQRIGKPMTPDAEVIKTLNPDIFFSEQTLKESTEKSLANLKIESDFLDLSNYDAILASIEKLGKSLGMEQAAQKLNGEIQAKAEAAIKKVEGKQAPKVLFLFGTPKSIMVGSGKSYVGSLLKKLNIPQIQAELPPPYAPLSLENVVSENPDVILVMSHGDPETSKKMVQATFDKNEAMKNVAAVKNDKVVYLNEKIFSVTGNVHVGEALEELVQIAYD